MSHSPALQTRTRPTSTRVSSIDAQGNFARGKSSPILDALKLGALDVLDPETSLTHSAELEARQLLHLLRDAIVSARFGPKLDNVHRSASHSNASWSSTSLTEHHNPSVLRTGNGSRTH